MRLALQSEITLANKKVEDVKKLLKKTNVKETHKKLAQQCHSAFNRVHCLVDKR